jgi:hypothetical protein
VSITKRSNKLTQLGVRRAKTSPQQRCSSIWRCWRHRAIDPSGQAI